MIISQHGKLNGWQASNATIFIYNYHLYSVQKADCVSTFKFKPLPRLGFSIKKAETAMNNYKK
tara:strand:+ start:5390 stop:5578 length:189 start_codon:yes stop_codon:yes gene_type:complete